MAVVVTDHAMWRAAERFPYFDTVTIEGEVRDAMRAGRVSAERAQLGLRPQADPRSLYVWTEDGERIYAVRADRRGENVFVVTTTMNRADWRAA